MIRFREVNYKKKPDRKRKYNGAIYVDTETYGIKKLRISVKKKNEGIITSTRYSTITNGSLPMKKAKLKMGKMAMDDKVHADDKKDKKKLWDLCFPYLKIF